MKWAEVFVEFLNGNAHAAFLSAAALSIRCMQLYRGRLKKGKNGWF
ncbi:hypothetical protein l11_14640 [Neisseria weaveri LMG 5135]|nr:hypothetical protein l11_14640 [Neisseria weaveri LMG 5135]